MQPSTEVTWRTFPRTLALASGLGGRVVMGLLVVAACAQAQEPARDGPRTSLHQAQVGGTPSEPRIDVASVILAAPASEVTLSITVIPQSAIPPQSFVRIRGLPPTAALSDGHAIQPGAWAVPLAALSNLRIIVPAGLSGKREVTISLVTGDGSTLAEAKAALVIAAAGLITPDDKEKDKPARPQAAPSPPPPLVSGPAPASPPAVVPPVTVAPPPPAPTVAPPPASAAVPSPAAPVEPSPPTPAVAPPSPPVKAIVPPPSPPPQAKAAAPPQPPPAAPPAKQATPPVVAALPPPEPPIAAKPKGPPPMAPEARRRAEQYLDRASKLLRDGDIASARLFLQRAADEGLAEAALAMGGTFDGDELTRLRAHGIRPDPAEARRWYERAAELGSGEAQDRLKRLGAR